MTVIGTLSDVGEDDDCLNERSIALPSENPDIQRETPPPPPGCVDYNLCGSPLRLPTQNGAPLDLHFGQLACGTLITGSMGTGKTTAVIQPLLREILRHPASPGALILDVKDDCGTVCRNLAEEVGCPPERIKVIEPGGTERMNLLFPWMPSSKIADAFMAGLRARSEDPYWVQSAIRLLDLEISVVRALVDPSQGNITFDDIRALHTDLTTAETQPGRKRIGNMLSIIMSLLESRSLDIRQEQIQDERVVRNIEAMKSEMERFIHLNDRTRTSITATLDGGLYPMGSSELGYTFCASGKDETVSIEEIVSKGTILVVSVPKHRWGLVGEMICTQIKRGLYSYLIKERRAPRYDYRPVFVVMDEAQNLLTFDDSSESEPIFASLARSLACCLIVATQDVASFYAAASLERHESIDNLLRNLNTQFYLAQPFSRHLARLLVEQGITSSQFVSKMINGAPKFSAVMIRRAAVAESYSRSYKTSATNCGIVHLRPSFLRNDGSLSRHEAKREESYLRRGAEYMRKGACRRSPGKGILILGAPEAINAYVDDATASSVPFIRLHAMDLIESGRIREDVLADELAKMPLAILDKKDQTVLLFLDALESVFEISHEALLALRRLTTPSHTLIRTGIEGLTVKSRQFRLIASWDGRKIEKARCGFQVNDDAPPSRPPAGLDDYFELLFPQQNSWVTFWVGRSPRV